MPLFSRKYNLAQSGLLKGFTDWHSHLLPGVDDGVQQAQETIEILEEYARHGVSEVWLTPHVMEDYPNEPAQLQARFDELKKLLAKESEAASSIKLRLAAENMLDNLFDQRMENDQVLTIGPHSDMMLVETSYFTPPFDMDQKLEKVMKAGYFPLLAHPERYTYMDMPDYDSLLERGVRLQLNLYSLFGIYGPDVQDKARRLLKQGSYAAVGSDTHRARQLQYALATKALSSKEINALERIMNT